jgi:metallo-beta-lactamase class B
MKLLRYPILSLLILLSCHLAQAQMTLKIQLTPTYYTPLLDNIHAAGTFNQWAPGSTQHILNQQPDGSYTVQITGTQGATIEYKYTRGDWPQVETQANGAFLANRSVVYNNGQTITDTVAMWEDMAGPHTAVGNTHILDLDFNMPQLNRNRRIWVYLPQDYYTSTTSYPVLYMHDGQNLFDVAYTAFGTEWSIDESMKILEDSGYTKAIIVGMDNGGVDRIDEYSAWNNPQYGGGQGALYMNWTVNTLKPFIDGYFRTLPDRSNTALMGSSLGGLISLYGGLQRQDVFSRLGVFSPSFWFDDSCYTHAATQGRQQAMRIYLLAGGQESATMIPNMYRMQDTLLAHGFSSSDIRTVTKSDGQHSEWFWAREFGEAFKWLFSGTLTSSEADPGLTPTMHIAPNPIRDSFVVRADFPVFQPIEVLFRDINGKEVLRREVRNGEHSSVPELAGGIYIAEMRYGTRLVREKILVE